MKAVCVVPKFDEATEYSYRWFARLREQLQGQVEFILLLLADAVRDNVEKALQENPDVMLLHYDHGTEDQLIGQDKKPVIDLVNVALLKGRESYNMNCLSAYTLGKAAYKSGCEAYWGFTQVVSFTSNAEQSFCEAFNYGFILWMKGKSWMDCLTETKNRMTEIMASLLKNGDVVAAMLLREDRDALVCYTQENPPPPESCPVSRIISGVFGYRVLTGLRRIRDRLKSAWR